MAHRAIESLNKDIILSVILQEKFVFFKGDFTPNYIIKAVSHQHFDINVLKSSEYITSINRK